LFLGGRKGKKKERRGGGGEKRKRKKKKGEKGYRHIGDDQLFVDTRISRSVLLHPIPKGKEKDSGEKKEKKKKENSNDAAEELHLGYPLTSLSISSLGGGEKEKTKEEKKGGGERKKERRGGKKKGEERLRPGRYADAPSCQHTFTTPVSVSPMQKKEKGKRGKKRKKGGGRGGKEKRKKKKKKRGGGEDVDEGCPSTPWRPPIPFVVLHPREKGKKKCHTASPPKARGKGVERKKKKGGGKGGGI